MNDAADLRLSVGEKGRLPRIGGMATMPSRAHLLGTVLASILPQLDRLFIFFDKYKEVSHAFTTHPKIVALTPARFGELAGAGKFLGLQRHEDPCLYYCFDDDILYPSDYVEVLTRALYRHRLRAIAGFHAAILKRPYRSYIRDRTILHFRSPCETDCFADLLGTGTLAFYSGTLRFDPKSWPSGNMCDLMVAIEAARQSVPRVAIRRPLNYLLPLEEAQSDSVFEGIKRDDSHQSEIMREALKSCRLSWHDSPAEEFGSEYQKRRAIVIDTTHGVAPGANSSLFVHRNLLDRDRFATYLRGRKPAYVSLAACLEGEGDALTIDDSTVAAADAARLARENGHAVTLFVNGYNIAFGKCYPLARLDAALDARRVDNISYDGSVYGLRLTSQAREFRAQVKERLLRLRSEQEREDLVSDIGRLLGLEEIIVPAFLQPIRNSELIELANCDVDIQNHGWTHMTAGMVPADEYAGNIRRGRQWLNETCGARADLFAVPNGACLPPWHASEEYSAWLLLDGCRPPGMLAPALYNRRTLTEDLMRTS